MGIRVKLQRDRHTALYRHIAEEFRTRIARGELPPGTRLPTVRALAREVGTTRLTIHNAYRELQADGLIESVVGRGTFVSPQARPAAQPSLGERLEPDLVLSDLHRLQHARALHNLALATADPALFPYEAFWACLEGLKPLAREVFGYGSVMGEPELRVALSELLEQRGIEADPQEVLVTVGGLQGLALVCRALAEPGEEVLLEEPTYLGLLGILKQFRLKPLPVPLDAEGPRLEVLEALLKRHRPRFYYTIPSYHNPTGLRFCQERLRRLLALAQAHGFTLVEDDTLGCLSYEKTPPTPLYALAQRLGAGSQVVHLASLSKVLMPGLRIGYLLAPEALLERFTALHNVSDITGPPPLLQRAAAQFIRQGSLKQHLKQVLPIYQRRRDALLQALSRHMPAGVHWSRPEGGFSCWVSLPRLFSTLELHRQALARGVAITPGEAFLVRSDEAMHFRLCFGAEGAEGLEEGVKELARLIRARQKV
ncbi:PLP-dependent aminotransferase family protein [Meiothermus sp. QL-1]|uniref:aminotransferase-like domain-containing protein n=1 Tax=Meiothermus sp. QL-1 TaxID=2058095 RepID=UPI000E0B1F0A|nr:PLP-dependent aminotransferase family protein [Meiothermus sp. QL-1]RDI95748.1 PLP-dependent aminotransferase family protein [Meiothermus sp. QL-1]